MVIFACSHEQEEQDNCYAKKPTLWGIIKSFYLTIRNG